MILSDAYTGIADLFRKAGQPDSCIFYARRALTSGQQNNYARGILAATELLSKVYGPIDEHEAFKYHKLATAVKDSLFNTEKASQVQNLFFVEQQRQQTLEAARTKYNNQLKLYALLAALSVFLLLAIILWRNNRHRQPGLYSVAKPKAGNRPAKANGRTNAGRAKSHTSPAHTIRKNGFTW